MSLLIEHVGRPGIASFGRHVKCGVPDPDAFFVRIHRCDLSALTLIRSHMSPAVQTPMIERFQDMVSVAVMLSGRTSIESRSSRALLGVGQAFFDVGWGHRVNRFDVAIDVMSVMIPAETARERGLSVDPDRLTLGPDKPTLAARAFAHVVTPLLAVGKASREEASIPYVEAAIIELTMGLYLEARGVRASGSEFHNSLSAQARTIIAQEFRDHSLTVAVVAERLSVSLRSLHRAFEGSGTTVAAEIRWRRCDLAEKLLRDPLHRARTNLDIAGASGFGSTTELRRAVTSRHGMSVREFRHAAFSPILDAQR